MPLSIMLADDHQIVRQGLKALLERENFEIVAEATDGHEAVRLARELQPAIAVLDFAMPVLNGLDAAREIHLVAPHTRTILLTVHTDDHYVLESVRAGVKGYVLKTQAAEDLIRAIHEVSNGQVYLSPAVSRAVVDAYLTGAEPPPDPLTRRERQVLQLIAEGRTTKEIAQVLGLSVKTAESHRSRIMEKLAIHEVAGLVRYAIRRCVIEP
jgi:two-component system, NarL family, response regulator NreC